MDELRLIKDAQKGNVQAYNTLVLTYQDDVYHVALRIMVDPGLAADMTQDAFIRAYKNLRRFKDGNFKAWLMRIVTNRCYDELRKHKRRPQVSIDEMTEENESYAPLRDDGQSPEEERESSEMMAAIQSCLESLPDEQRIAAILCDVEGYDYNEIAKIMDVSLGTVKSRMSRARSKLRDCLRGFLELLPAGYR
jgi:RNA polymerase sigma-70 factor (ECF subfamily)